MLKIAVLPISPYSRVWLNLKAKINLFSSLGGMRLPALAAQLQGFAHSAK